MDTQQKESPKQWLARMTSKFRRFPSYKPEVQDETTSEMLKELAREFGREKVEKGLNDSLFDKNRKDKAFPPCPADLRAYIERADLKPTRLGAPKKGCTACDETGFKEVPNSGGRVAPCDCRRL